MEKKKKKKKKYIYIYIYKTRIKDFKPELEVIHVISKHFYDLSKEERKQCSL